MISPEQGAQQECSRSDFSPLGGIRVGRSDIVQLILNLILKKLARYFTLSLFWGNL